MVRRLAIGTLVLALVHAGDAAAEPRGGKAQKAEKAQKTEKTQPAKKAPRPPLQLYLAKGEANVCGEGCSEWIAVEGSFDEAAAARVQAFLRRHGARTRPIYFHSPGGNEAVAHAIGRYLRQSGVVTGVGRTIPHGCAPGVDLSDACRVAKASTQSVVAEWRPDGNCSSACVWALVGGKVRHVPPSARLGIHASKLTLVRRWSDGRVQQVSAKEAPSLHKVRYDESTARTRRYLRDMGIDPTLQDAALKVAHEDIRYLSRDEIAAFGIDRSEFAETRWFVTPTSGKSSVVVKWIVEARGSEHKAYRASHIVLACAGPRRATIRYWRGLTSEELGRPLTIAFMMGSHKVDMSQAGTATKGDVFDRGGMFAISQNYAWFDVLDAAAAVETLDVTLTEPKSSPKVQRVLKLSTQGLAEGVKMLRDRCV